MRFSFARAAGPGGQNVNKVNSKAILAWSINEERGHRITIEKHGAWTTWAAVGTHEVCNKRLFLELAEELGTSVTWDVANA